MKYLLITNNKLSKIISKVKKNDDFEIIIIKRNLKETLKKKTKKFSKVILITEKILPRNSEVYKIISNFTQNEKSFFMEISHSKCSISRDKASSNALINGSGSKTSLILEKIIKTHNV